MKYPLQETERALRWYGVQAEFYGSMTRWMLVDAGIRPGMNVLDIGTGGGDVAVILSDLVGPTGRVLAIDISGEAISGAKTRVTQKNVEFMQADLNLLNFPRSFDAVVGRFVLMYAANPSLTLSRLARLVRDGGLVAFLEPDYSGTRSSEQCPLCTKVQGVIESILQRSGADTKMGLKLYHAFADAGLQNPILRCAAAIGGGSDFAGYAVAAGFLKLLVPLAAKCGLSVSDDLDLDNIEQRMRTEVEESGGAIVFPSIIGAWAHVTDDGA